MPLRQACNYGLLERHGALCLHVRARPMYGVYHPKIPTGDGLSPNHTTHLPVSDYPAHNHLTPGSKCSLRVPESHLPRFPRVVPAYYKSSLLETVMATYNFLNSTAMNITQDCWLCLDRRPHYYVGVGYRNRSFCLMPSPPFQQLPLVTCGLLDSGGAYRVMLHA